MLASTLGHEVFINGLRKYLREHLYGNATSGVRAGGSTGRRKLRRRERRRGVGWWSPSG